MPRPPPVAPAPRIPELRGCGQTQTLRQFASAALQAGQGDGCGFHTPRSGGGVSGRFDSEGYPLSPGGTSIKPAAGPPPVSPQVTSFAASAPVGLRLSSELDSAGSVPSAVRLGLLDPRITGTSAGYSGVPEQPVALLGRSC